MNKIFDKQVEKLADKDASLAEFLKYDTTLARE